jgi:type IV secretory pathway VirB9-like protein
MIRGANAVFASGLAIFCSVAPVAGQGDPLRSGPVPGASEDVTLTRQTEAQSRSPRAQDLARQNHVMLFPYGREQPRLICAPLRACHIELAAGERPLDRSGGDLVRWLVSAIRGPNESWLIVVKPRYCDITTDLLVTTDKRVYSFVLDSPPCGGADSTQLNPRLPYTSVLRFYYPDEEQAAFALDSTAQAFNRHRTVLQGSSAPGSANPATPATGINFGYDVRRDRGFPFLPEHVYDNGSELFIHVPATANDHDLPVVYEVSATGAIQMLKYRFEPERNLFRIEGLPTRTLLVIGGAGGREIRLLVERRGNRR